MTGLLGESTNAGTSTSLVWVSARVTSSTVGGVPITAMR